MSDDPKQIERVAADWLARLEKALSTADRAKLRSLFHVDSHWRDVLALTWQIETVSGGESVVHGLGDHVARTHPSRFAIDSQRTPPRRVVRAGVETIEAIFAFETIDGRGSGVVRLTPEPGGRLKAWTLLTALEALNGHEEHVGPYRPRGES